MSRNSVWEITPAVSLRCLETSLSFAFQKQTAPWMNPCAIQQLVSSTFTISSSVLWSHLPLRNTRCHITWTGHFAIYVRWLLCWRYIPSLHSADEPQQGETAAHSCDPALSVLSCWCLETFFSWDAYGKPRKGLAGVPFSSSTQKGKFDWQLSNYNSIQYFERFYDSDME